MDRFPWVGDGGRGGSGRPRGRGGFFATFTAYDSRWGTRGQLVGRTVSVQVAENFLLREPGEAGGPDVHEVNNYDVASRPAGGTAEALNPSQMKPRICSRLSRRQSHNPTDRIGK